MNKIAFIRPADTISPRIRKLTNICEEIFDEVHFLGAKRSKVPTPPENTKVKFKLIGIYYPYSSLKYILGTIVFVFVALARLIVLRPKVIHGSDLEGAIPAVIYKLFFRKTYVLINVHDNYFARYKVSERFKKFLKYVEYTVYSGADICLFPDDNRIKLFEPYKFKKTWSIPNTPADPGFVSPPSVNGKIKLFLAGFVSKVRGLDMLIELVKRNKNIELHVAGRAVKDDMDKIDETENAIYHGRMAQEEVLKLGQSCHLVPIFYAPDVEIHVYASPNKLFDAFALGRPVVMNNGINVAEIVTQYNMGGLVDYNDVDALDKAITEITENQEAYDVRCKSIRHEYEKSFRWEVYRKELISFFKALI